VAQAVGPIGAGEPTERLSNTVGGEAASGISGPPLGVLHAQRGLPRLVGVGDYARSCV
jgi:hypothetical protein